MSEKFNPETARYKIVITPLIAYVQVKVPIDFDLETQESEEYPDFWLYDEARARSSGLDWEISEDIPLEFEED